jgi:hypothetical protein
MNRLTAHKPRTRCTYESPNTTPSCLPQSQSPTQPNPIQIALTQLEALRHTAGGTQTLLAQVLEPGGLTTNACHWQRLGTHH